MHIPAPTFSRPTGRADRADRYSLTAFAARVVPALAALVLLTGCEPKAEGPGVCPPLNVSLTELKDSVYVDLVVDPAIDSEVETLRNNYNIPGCALALVENNEIASLNFYGDAEIGPGARPWDAGTPAHVGSIAKTLTALAVLQLVEDGELDLNLPLVDFMTGLPPGWQGVTLSELLSNTSGIRKDPNQVVPPGNEAELQAFFPGTGNHPGIHPHLAFVTYWGSDDTTSFAPGNSARYSNIAYSLAGMAIDYETYGPLYLPPVDNRTGYERFVFQRVGYDIAPDPGNPKGEPIMASLCLGTPSRASQIFKRAVGYAADGVTEVWPTYSGWEGPPGGWTMTIGDLARLMIIINTHRRITETTTDQMMLNYGSSNINYATNGKKKWGYGVYRDLINLEFAFGKGGNYPGFTSHFIMWREPGVGAGLICNRSSVPEEDMVAVLESVTEPFFDDGPFGGSRGGAPQGSGARAEERNDPISVLLRDHTQAIDRLAYALVELPGDFERDRAREAFLATALGRELHDQLETGDLEALAETILEQLENPQFVDSFLTWLEAFEGDSGEQR